MEENEKSRTSALIEKLGELEIMADFCSDRLNAINETPNPSKRSVKTQQKNYRKGLDLISASVFKNISQNLGLDNEEVKQIINEGREDLKERKNANKSIRPSIVQKVKDFLQKTKKIQVIEVEEAKRIEQGGASSSLSVSETSQTMSGEVSNDNEEEQQKTQKDGASV